MVILADTRVVTLATSIPVSLHKKDNHCKEVGRIGGKVIHFGHLMNKMIQEDKVAIFKLQNRTTFLRFEYRIPSPMNHCNNTLEWHH